MACAPFYHALAIRPAVSGIPPVYSVRDVPGLYHPQPPPPPPAPSASTALTLQSVGISPFIVAAGTNSTGRVVLTAVAPAGGCLVTVESNNATVIVPSSVIVPEGSIEAYFPVASSQANSGTVVTVSAYYGGATRTATLAIR